jgi:hypothetical protein
VATFVSELARLLLLLVYLLQTNFETTKSSADFAALYMRDALPGGHVIMLGPNCEEVSLFAPHDIDNNHVFR